MVEKKGVDCHVKAPAQKIEKVGDKMAVAIAQEMTLEDVGNIIHPHPSFVESLCEAARL